MYSRGRGLRRILVAEDTSILQWAVSCKGLHCSGESEQFGRASELLQRFNLRRTRECSLPYALLSRQSLVLGLRSVWLQL